MASNYDGLTRNVWPGTWSTGTNSPIVLDTEIRGTLHSITGVGTDTLTNIPGARIQEGMLVYVKTTYTSGSTTYTGDNYYTYKLQGGQSRDASTGAVPNADANWSLFSVSGGSGYTGSAGAIGFTGSAGAIGYTGSKGDLGYSGSKGDTGFTGSKGDQGTTGFAGSKGDQGDIGYTGSAGAIGYTGSKGLQGATGFTGSKGDQGDQGDPGYVGSKGDVGFTGSKGDLGYAGSVGFTGSRGEAGADGSDGATGFTGSKGDLGYTGSVGYTGSKGDTGFDGSKGDTGFAGSKGDLGYTGSIGYSGSKGDQGAIGYTGSEGNLDVSLSSTPPGSAGLGDVWIDDATGIQYFYMNDGNSNQWVELANQGVVGFTGSVGYTGSSSALANIQDESYGVSVTGKIAVSTIDIGTGGINASPGGTYDLQGTTINFGSATIMGGNAFDGVINNHLWSGSTAPTNGYVLSWNTSLLSGAGDYEWVNNLGLNNIQDESYGVSVTGKMAITTIDIGSSGGINASAGATFDLQGTTINFGSATIMGGNAFDTTINNHLWSGSTAPTNGYVLSWNTSLLSGNGDYEWVAQSSGSSITAGNSSVSVADTGTDGEVTFRTEGTDRWDITNSGHLLPVAHETYDIGSATRKVRHLFLSDNSLKMGDNEVSIGLTSDKLTVGGEHVSISSYESNTTAGAIDITKRHHFIKGGVNYTLADGTYTGQELHFWRSAVGSGYSDITIANAKWTIPGDTTDARTNFVWRTNGDGPADNRTFMAVWDGAGWCLSGGSVAA